MANVFKVIDMIANEGLAIAHETATFISTIDRQYDESFKPTGAGKKIGGTLRIREPNQYTRRQGSRIMDIQDQGETTQTLTVATQDGVDMTFNSAELALNTDDPDQVEAFSKRYIQPAMSALISGIDADMLVQFTKDIYNVAGTAGTVVGASNDTSALGNARAKLNQGLAPKITDDRAFQIDSVTMGSIQNANKAIFQPDDQVKKAFVEGRYAKGMGAIWYENERTYSHVNGSDVTGTTHSAAAVTDGGNSMTWDSSATIVPTVGSVFTVAGIYACHPETKQAYPNLQQFVISAIDSGNRIMTVSPSTYLTGAKKNVVKSDGTALATTDFNTQTLTFWGAASTAYRQNLIYHKDAFVFVTADLPMMDDAAKCVVKRLDNLSVRVWMGSDIRADELLVRLDILYGGKTVRPAWGCRISN